jgi:NAD(P)-dependent dehydrogenase (short-subunit alcohol dehydrogenase family)
MTRSAAPPLASALDFRGRVALITGGARGIGRGIAERFLEAGAEVAICGRNAPQTPPNLGGRSAAFFACDVRDAEQVARTTEAVAQRFGRLDVLVANAGGAPAADAATASPRFHERIIQLNLVAPLHCAQRANAVMQQQPQGGVIEFIASVSAIRPSPGTAAYGAAKAGLLSLAASLAVEWAPRVRVVAVTAGLIRTEQAHLHYGDEAGVAAVGRTIPLGRMGDPEDIADACLFLASPLARYVSGASLLAHGGGEAPAFLGAARNTEEQ